MADRKKQREQAIQESVEMSEMAKKPQTKPTSTPEYSISAREKAEAAAPYHPRAGKSLGVRNRELMIGKMAAQAAEARKIASFKDPDSRRTDRPLREGTGSVEAPAPEMKTPFNNRRTKSGKVISKPISAGGKAPKKTSAKSNVNDDRLKQIDADLRFKQSRASEFNKRLK